MESRFRVDLRLLGKIVGSAFLMDDTAKVSFNLCCYCGTLGAKDTGYLFFNPSIRVDDEF